MILSEVVIYLQLFSHFETPSLKLSKWLPHPLEPAKSSKNKQRQGFDKNPWKEEDAEERSECKRRLVIKGCRNWTYKELGLQHCASQFLSLGAQLCCGMCEQEQGLGKAIGRWCELFPG